MTPQTARFGANSSERRRFNALQGVPDRPDWIVFHPLVIQQHVEKLMGKADFVVVVPRRSVVVVEAQATTSIDYIDGTWHRLIPRLSCKFHVAATRSEY